MAHDVSDHLQLIESGEKDRLKQLLRRKLQECGWRDDIKERCRGEHIDIAVLRHMTNLTKLMHS
jgi:hypothetical protein